MKLLIVDDEELTRTGVISSIDWQSIGIDEVLQADDGVNGIEVARAHRPDIVLCDVRMPRLDGIAMLERLEGILPDIVPVFMSGYSDKEYLKAAIKLKAVNYIEKPLDPSEIREAIIEARDLCLEKKRTRHNESMHSLETASHLALLLTQPYAQVKESISQLTDELALTLGTTTTFTAIVLKTDNTQELPPSEANAMYLSIRDFLKPFHMDCIFAEKHVQYMVYFLFGPAPGASAWKSIEDFFCNLYSRFARFSIAAGDTLTGISKAYQSYTSAVILLQNSFFFPAGTFLSPNKEASLQEKLSELPANPENEFLSLLTAKNEEKTRAFLETLFHYYDRNQNTLPNQAKDMYYKLFRTLDEAARQLKLTLSDRQENLIDALEKVFSFDELHQKLLAKTENFFQTATNTEEENSTIYLIKDYISQKYMNETLSVKDISDHVFLSTSYVCTFFKNETGQTLNQYLTEYRMEKAKQLLSDPRYKIADISSRVGYSDGNYFGKSFKKYTGFSPSEYREKMS
ncbi:response regulator transcription factor [Blautia sp. HCP3S3_H10_1]|uniref:response regulator transcription factor n=1 Tax=unclassified Blautia TaxID=2648079 RepID=UPI003F91D0A1|nr:response regulator [Clostridia bacterium]